MKKQNNFLQGTAIALTFLTTLQAGACKQESTRQQAHTASQEKTKPPKVDIHTAVITGNTEAIRQHIAAGTNLNQKDPMGGSSPLISAALFGKTDIAKLLMDAGADIHFQNNDGSTALHTAAFFCRPDIVQLLLAKKADRTVKNSYGLTPYELVSGPFASVKEIYNGMGKMLAPMGLVLDNAYLENTRPQIARMLK